MACVDEDGANKGGLEPRWSERQFQKAEESIKHWPDWMLMNLSQTRCHHLFSIPDSTGKVECLLCGLVQPAEKKEKGHENL